MFKAPFSFKGRISRKEYVITFLISLAYYIILRAYLIDHIFESFENVNTAFLVYVLAFVPLIFFNLTQGVKRCHDCGKSGWYMLIPFYEFYLLGADGEFTDNKWGKTLRKSAIAPKQDEAAKFKENMEKAQVDIFGGSKVLEKAENGDTEAQFEMGFRFFEGRSNPQSYKNAFFWWEKAAAQGEARAQYNLGFCYLEGIFVDKNQEKAIEWLTKSSNNNNKKAQELLAKII